MATLKIVKANALPGTPSANTAYYVKQANGTFLQYLTDSTGAVTFKGAVDPTTVKFNRYDLPTSTTATGAMDLSLNQVFKINASSAGATIPMSFTNAPASTQAMAIIVEVLGSARQVTLPVGTVIADGVDNTLGTIRSIMVFFYDGTTFTLSSNGRINS